MRYGPIRLGILAIVYIAFVFVFEGFILGYLQPKSVPDYLKDRVEIIVLRTTDSSGEVKVHQSELLRRALPLVLSAVLLLGCWQSEPVGSGSTEQSVVVDPSETHNVILVVLDTLRSANLSSNGYRWETSPRLDGFARQSVVFQNVASVGGNTTTSMAGLMSGRTPFHPFGDTWDPKHAHGMKRFYTRPDDKGLPPSLYTLAERFRDAGYRTAGLVTNVNVSEDFQFQQGFDSYELIRSSRRPGRAGTVVEKARDFLDGRKRGERFFLYLHFMDVHGPYDPPSGYERCFGEARPVPPETDDAFWVWEDRETPPARRGPLLERMAYLYDCELLYLDTQLGVLFDHIDTLGLSDSTVVAVFSDHGEEFLEHGGTTHKGTLYEEILDVPMMVRVPGVAPSPVDAMVRSFDLMPTLLELAGVNPAKDPLDAVSLRSHFGLPPLEERMEGNTTTSLSTFPARWSFREGTHKLIRTQAKVKDAWELYYLAVDPGEQNNLHASSAHAPLAAKLEAGMRAAALRITRGPADPASSGVAAQPATVAPGSKAELDEDTRAQLKALGYIE